MIKHMGSSQCIGASESSQAWQKYPIPLFLSLCCRSLIRIWCYSPPILLNDASPCSWLSAPTVTMALILLFSAWRHQQLALPVLTETPAWDLEVWHMVPHTSNSCCPFSPHMPFAILASLRCTVFVLKVSIFWITSFPSLQDQNQLLELVVPFINLVWFLS